MKKANAIFESSRSISESLYDLWVSIAIIKPLRWMLTMSWTQYSLLITGALILTTTYDKSVTVALIFRDEENMTMRDYTVLKVTQ